MDFWASLEHKIYYKFEGKAPAYISRDLRECAEMVSALDEKMLSLNEAILECLRQQKNGREEERQEELEENQIQLDYRRKGCKKQSFFDIMEG